MNARNVARFSPAPRMRRWRIVASAGLNAVGRALVRAWPLDRWDVLGVAGAGLFGGGIWELWGAAQACMFWGGLLLGMTGLHEMRVGRRAEE